MKVIMSLVRGLTVIVYVIIIAALAIAAPMLVGYRPVVVLSGSMVPSYSVGSIIYYKPTAYADIQVGDAITFRIGDSSLATHRVVEKNETDQTFVTKGDNNPSIDAEPVEYHNVVGKTTDFMIPYAGFMTKYMQNWFAIAIMGVILLLDMIAGFRKKSSGEHVSVSDS